MIDNKPRFLIVGNWLLFACNIVLSIVLIMVLIAPWATFDSAAVNRAHKEAELIEKKVYFAKGPFAILVDKSFPNTHGFTFADYSQQLTAQGYPTDGDTDAGATRTAMLTVGADLALSCDYKIVGAEDKPQQLEVESVMLQTKGKGVYDLNVDGIFDQQIVTDDKSGTGHEEIWYDGQWQEVVPHGEVPRFQRQLPNVGRVAFDKASGRWTRVANDKQNEPNEIEHGATPNGSH